ncbi:hypothetical protein IWQ61_000318 [Dispira simplex]|nr:hypothetical protein IWQ61_000318 [Dispira simplex]
MGAKSVRPDALNLVTEYMRLFTIEAIHRAVYEGQKKGVVPTNTIDIEHLEKILPQLMLDF